MCSASGLGTLLEITSFQTFVSAVMRLLLPLSYNWFSAEVFKQPAERQLSRFDFHQDGPAFAPWGRQNSHFPHPGESAKSHFASEANSSSHVTSSLV
jgi:hypothetical protein